MNGEAMTCETMRERLSERLQGALAARESAELEAHLAGCAECAAEAAILAELWSGLAETGEPVPSGRMRARLAEAIAAEAAPTAAPLAFPGRAGLAAPVPAGEAPAADAGRRLQFGRRLLALAAMLLVGLGLGYLAFGRQSDDVATLRREVGDLHEMVALSLLERGSVSDRLQGVAYGRDYAAGPSTGAGDDRIVAALFARLLEDPSVNVRLAALEALRPIARSAGHRDQLVAAVTRQASPLVALSLIDLLLESGEPAARHDLEELLANDQLDPVVRGYLRDRLGRSA